MHGDNLRPIQRVTNQIVPQNISDLERLATAFAASGMFKDARTMGQALVKMMAGQEFGIGPYAAMTGIYIVDGKPTMAATTIGGIIKKSGKYDYKIVTLDDTQCSLDFYEHGEKVGNSTFTMSDAAKAGLTANATYKKYPRNMLLSRALTNGARWYTPDVFGGAVYTPDEINQTIELNARGEVVNVEALTVAPVSPPQAEIVAPPERKPITNVALKALYESAPFDSDKPKLGAWLESSGIAPGLSSGRKLTAQESIVAEDTLRAMIENANADANAAPPEPDEAPLPVVEKVGISAGQRMRIMAMFNSAGITDDHDRHAYAERILGKGKGSTKTWTESDYARVSDALEGKA